MKRIKRLATCILLLFLCQLAEAQGFIDLTASEVEIDSLLPVYTYQRQLKGDFADSVYTVSIEYPEFVDMSKADIRRYQKISGKPLPELPVISKTVAVARKQGLLEVSFVPLVFRDGKYQKLVSFKLNIESRASGKAMTRATAASNRYADHSVLREGKWVKISIPDNGFYQLTSTLVKKAGFSDLSKVKIYGYGGALQPESLTGDYLAETDDLKEVPTCTVGSKRM